MLPHRLLAFALLSALLAVAPSAGAAVFSEPFTSSGTWSVPAGVTSIDVLVVGGGGGGGGAAGSTGAGGGGGEVKVCTGLTVAADQQLTVTVGSGGAAATGATFKVGASGGASSVARASTSLCSGNGGVGGGGGQVSPYYRGGAAGGGNAGGTSGNSSAGGGGGGAASAGGAATYPSSFWIAGDGGNGIAPGSLASPGLFADVTGDYYGGGGGGGLDGADATKAGAGGTGGGGSGRPKAAGPAGAANTGGGGGGSGNTASFLAGGDGGSGYVVVRYAVVAPTSTVAPVVSGSSTVGTTVSTTDGTWSGSLASLAYAWQRCDDDQGTGCADINGASGATYTIASADAGKYLRSRVTATNLAGSAAAFSSDYVRVAAAAVAAAASGSAEPPAIESAAPSNRFTFALPATTRSVIRTRVSVPGAGRLVQIGIRSGSGARAFARACATARSASRAGTYTLTCAVNAATRLRQRSEPVRVVLRTTFTPTGGAPRTTTTVVMLAALASSEPVTG